MLLGVLHVTATLQLLLLPLLLNFGQILQVELWQTDYLLAANASQLVVMPLDWREIVLHGLWKFERYQLLEACTDASIVGGGFGRTIVSMAVCALQNVTRAPLTSFGSHFIHCKLFRTGFLLESRLYLAQWAESSQLRGGGACRTLR